MPANNQMLDGEKPEMASLHERLIAKQTTDELRRKQRKARQKGIWTQEDIDLINREAKELSHELGKLFD